MLKTPMGTVTYEKLLKAGLTDEHILGMAREMNSSSLLREAYRPHKRLSLPESLEFDEAVGLLHSYLHED